MDHLSHFLPKVESEFLSFIRPLARQNLDRRLKTGEINSQEYTEQALKIAADTHIKRLQISTPDFAAPNVDDKDFNVHEYYKMFAKAVETDKTCQYNLRIDLQKKAPGLVSKIFDDWEALQAIVGAYSEVLSRRWSKKIVDKRKALLLEAWPAMPPAHRPDFDLLRRGLKGPKYRDMIMMPYINLEDLSTPRYLLQMLDSRTKMPPEHFAWSDSAPFQAAVRMQAVRDDPGFSEVMLLTEQKTRGSYGRLQSLENQAEIEDIIWTGYGFQLGRGLTVLEIQARLYGFLLCMAKLLLHDFDLSSLTADSNIPHTYRKTEQAPEPKEWLSIVEINTQTFYGLPQPFSLTNLRRLVVAKRDEAEDSFCTLREDPAFFQTHISLYQSQHIVTQRKILRDETLGLVYKAGGGALKSAWVHVIHKTCRDVVTWNSIATEISRLEMLRASLHIDQRPLSKRLPPEYENAMGRFMCMMTFLWRLAVRDLGYVAASSPKLVDYFDFAHSIEHGFSTVQLKESLEDEWPPILHFLVDIGREETSEFMGSMSMLEEMQRTVNSDQYHCAPVRPR